MVFLEGLLYEKVLLDKDDRGIGLGLDSTIGSDVKYDTKSWITHMRELTLPLAPLRRI